MLPPFPVLIVGTGSSGLLLAHALKKANIPFHLFERDEKFNIRAQGYRFKVSGPGVLALQDVLGSKHFEIVNRSCGALLNNFTNLDALTAAPVGGGLPPKKQEKKAQGPEPLCADRSVFRAMLARGLEADIKFGHEFTGYDLSPDGNSVTATFSNGASYTGSILVAADGAWSRIRRQYLPDYRYLDTEARWLYGKTPITPQLRNELHEDLLKGVAIIEDRSQNVPVCVIQDPIFFDHTLTAETGIELPADYVYWAVGSRIDRLDMSALGEKPSSEACAAYAKNLVETWHPSFRPLIDHQDALQTSFLRIGSVHPQIPTWVPSRVTMVGDAAHAMSPSAGQGATTALRDAALLGRLLAEEGVSVESVGKYEAQMREWAGPPIQGSRFFGQKLWAMRDWPELKPFGEKVEEIGGAAAGA